MKYKTPEWKVLVGEFKTRIEADRTLNTIKHKFGGARVTRIILKNK